MTKDETFAAIELAAIEGRRCPTTDQGIKSVHVSQLAREGKILVEVSTHNWRRVTILTGPNKGKATAANPLKKFSTYLTIDKNGTLRNGRRVDYRASERRQPSAPQLLAPYAGKRS